MRSQKGLEKGMPAFRYARPSSVDEAVAMLAEEAGRAVPLAGGTDLLSLMKDGIERPSTLVALGGVAEMGDVVETDVGVRIGAMVPLEELRHDPLVQRYPMLASAAAGILSPQIRAMGTVGGDLCQRPRCWYYRSGFGLLGLQNGRSLVREGQNRDHAIFGEDDALFVCPSSLAPVLAALDAQVELAGPGGRTTRSVTELYRTPRSNEEREHTLEPEQVVVAVHLPSEAAELAAGGRVRSGLYEVRPRRTLDWPMAAAAVAAWTTETSGGGTVERARVVLGHVAPGPYLSDEAARALAGGALDEARASAAGEAAVTGARPLRDNQYKVDLARVATRRAVLRAAGEEVP